MEKLIRDVDKSKYVLQQTLESHTGGRSVKKQGNENLQSYHDDDDDDELITFLTHQVIKAFEG